LAGNSNQPLRISKGRCLGTESGLAEIELGMGAFLRIIEKPLCGRTIDNIGIRIGINGNISEAGSARVKITM
jgi:hypothetical protein